MRNHPHKGTNIGTIPPRPHRRMRMRTRPAAAVAAETTDGFFSPLQGQFIVTSFLDPRGVDIFNLADPGENEPRFFLG